VSAPKPAQAPVPAPKAPVDPGTPPVIHPPVIIDIDIPPLPPLPEKPEQEDPDPEPPDPAGPDLTLQTKPAEDPILQEQVPPQLKPVPPQPELTLATPGPQNAGPSLDQAIEIKP
jgi:hypothetical protein